MFAKKTIFLTGFFSAMVGSISFAQPCVQPQNDWQLNHLNGKVKQVSARSFLIDSTENGLEKTGKIDYFTAPDQESDWTFGTSGFLIAARYYDPLNGKADIRDSIELNASGCPVVAWKFFQESLGFRDSLFYEPKLMRISRNRYEGTQNTLRIETDYNRYGSAEERIFKPENRKSPNSRTRFLYDKTGRKISEQYFDAAGTYTGSDTLVYNHQLHTLKTINTEDSSFTVTWYLPNQLPDHEIRTNKLQVTRKQYTYQFDSHKNWIRRVTYYQGKPFMITERTLIYFEP